MLCIEIHSVKVPRSALETERGTFILGSIRQQQLLDATCSAE